MKKAFSITMYITLCISFWIAIVVQATALLVLLIDGASSSVWTYVWMPHVIWSVVCILCLFVELNPMLYFVWVRVLTRQITPDPRDPNYLSFTIDGYDIAVSGLSNAGMSLVRAGNGSLIRQFTGVSHVTEMIMYYVVKYTHRPVAEKDYSDMSVIYSLKHQEDIQ